MDSSYQKDTIIALATPPGSSAIAIIRLSGETAISLTNQVFQGKNLTQQSSHTLHFGTICDQTEIIDEVLVALFKAPTSFTKEDSIEISCHGSPYIIQQIIQLLIRQGARLAKPGEFTQRAFLNGQFDLAQAEAVADLIAANSAITHQTALYQMRGGFSATIKELRQKLIHAAAMLELALDFAEEDVDFASQEALETLMQGLIAHINPLLESFSLGNAIKNGISTVIVGKPNVGKSTLLNALLQEEKAIVSHMAGTTRDCIEDEMTIQGIRFRLIDTAGLRTTDDPIEMLGIAKTRQKMEQAALIVYVFDLAEESIDSISKTTQQLVDLKIPFIKVGNKLDAASLSLLQSLKKDDFVMISAAQKLHLDLLKEKMVAAMELAPLQKTNTLVTNVRHYESLLKSKAALVDVVKGIQADLSNEWLVLDMRIALQHLGEITGDITTEDLLTNIFANFCIGK